VTNIQILASVGIFLTIIGSLILFIPIVYLKITDVTDAFGKPAFPIEVLEPTTPNWAKKFVSKCWRIGSYLMTILGLIMQFVASICG
jgi:hypothetical protein